MALCLASRSGDDLEIQHEINVTPFIDVILVCDAGYLRLALMGL